MKGSFRSANSRGLAAERLKVATSAIRAANRNEIRASRGYFATINPELLRGVCTDAEKHEQLHEVSRPFLELRASWRTVLARLAKILHFH